MGGRKRVVSRCSTKQSRENLTLPDERNIHLPRTRPRCQQWARREKEHNRFSPVRFDVGTFEVYVGSLVRGKRNCGAHENLCFAIILNLWIICSDKSGSAMEVASALRKYIGANYRALPLPGFDARVRVCQPSLGLSPKERSGLMKKFCFFCTAEMLRDGRS